MRRAPPPRSAAAGKPPCPAVSTDYTKQLADIIATAEAAGWTVLKTGSGHWQFRPADTEAAIVHAAATSSDHRGITNLIAQLRRSGLDL